MKMFFRIYGGHYNVIRDCIFDGRSADSNEWSGAKIAEDGPGRTGEDSTHNRIQRCKFYRFVYKDKRPNRGTLLDIGAASRDSDRSWKNLIENCEFAYGGHHTLGVYSKYNVIRNNYIHNETNPEQWEFPGYRGAITQGSSAGRNLYEGNRIAYCDQNGLSIRSPYNIIRRNLFFLNGQAGMQVVTNERNVDRAENNHIYFNTFYRNGLKQKYRGPHGGMYIGETSNIGAKNNIVTNNVFYQNTQGRIGSDLQTIENNWDDDDSDPRFVDLSEGGAATGATRPDLRPSSRSRIKDKGAWLTVVKSPSGRGRKLRVENASFFSDGWEIIEGDRIQLDGQRDSAMITSIDYETNTIELDQDLRFSQGQGVALSYEGKAPDPGAYEMER